MSSYKEIIKVEKVNEAFVKIYTSDSIGGDIADFFTFFTPNYQFSPMFKARKWDGKIRLYNRKTSQLYSGLLYHLIQFAKEREIETQIDPKLLNRNKFDISDAEEYAKSLNLTSNKKTITPRDYQLLSFQKAIRNKKQLLISPTASGKSLIIYMMARFMLDFECNRGIIIVPTVSLVEQLYSDFEDYSYANNWNVEKNCQKIYSGHEKLASKKIIISTWQSVYDMPKEYFEQFDFIIGDESHLFRAQSLSKIMANLINTKYRIGTTGTLDDVKVNKLSLEGHFGPVFKNVTTKQLIDEGHLSDFEIKCIVLKYSDNICVPLKSLKKLDYQSEIDFIVTNARRNEFITDLALSLEKNTLILFQFVEKHGKILKEMLDSKVLNTNRKIFYVSGEVSAINREQIRSLVETETNSIIVASYGVYSTGINIRNLHNIIFASPSKSKIRNLQSIGRGLRLGDNKEIATLYDIVDDLRGSDNKINYALKHYAERMKIYHSEKFKVTTYRVSIKDG
jgi:superfamily II DNA or RNA helicase